MGWDALCMLAAEQRRCSVLPPASSRGGAGPGSVQAVEANMKTSVTETETLQMTWHACKMPPPPNIR